MTHPYLSAQTQTTVTSNLTDWLVVNYISTLLRTTLAEADRFCDANFTCFCGNVSNNTIAISWYDILWEKLMLIEGLNMLCQYCELYN